MNYYLYGVRVGYVDIDFQRDKRTVDTDHFLFAISKFVRSNRSSAAERAGYRKD